MSSRTHGLYPTANRPTRTLAVECLEDRSTPAAIPGLTAVGPGPGGGPVVAVLNENGSTKQTLTPFPTPISGDIRTAVADFNGDGISDFAIASGPLQPGEIRGIDGKSPEVRILDGKTGEEMFWVTPFLDFTGGLLVAAGDFTGDGQAELVVTPDDGGGPRLLVITELDGDAYTMVSFFGIDDPNFRGGLRTAVGNVNGDSTPDLVVSAGFGGGPRVAVYDGTTVTTGSPTRLVRDFFAFEPTLRNGAYVAIGDLDGDGLGEVIAGAGPGGGPRVLALSGNTLLTAGAEAAVEHPVANFFAGDVNNRGGIRVAAKDLDGDNRNDLVVGAGVGGGSRVTGYLGKDFAGGSAPEVFGLDVFPGLTTGVFVG